MKYFVMVVVWCCICLGIVVLSFLYINDLICFSENGEFVSMEWVRVLVVLSNLEDLIIWCINFSLWVFFMDKNCVV